jgi:hypothetical protein
MEFTVNRRDIDHITFCKNHLIIAHAPENHRDLSRNAIHDVLEAKITDLASQRLRCSGCKATAVCTQVKTA